MSEKNEAESAIDDQRPVEVTVQDHFGQLEKLDRPKEIGGRKGPEPTRFGDWEKNGRCIDF